MPRAPPPALLSLLLLLLLMVASAPLTAFAADDEDAAANDQQYQYQYQQYHQQYHEEQPPPLEITNPWLSACDLQPASATDLQGACSVAGAAMGAPATSHCPPPCPANSTTQCLYYLKESHKEELCGREMSPHERRRALQRYRMRHCCEHAVDSALPEAVLAGGQECRERLQALLEVDALAARVSCEFAEILTRYDCTQMFSIKYGCEDCKEAYRRWVCSSLVPHFSSPGQRVRPCLSVCQDVEQQCPYMLPGDRAPAHPTQYAGEPTFLCLDPNIPETGDQRAKSSHGEEDCCYTHCGTPGRGLCVECPPGASSGPTATKADADAVPVQCAATGSARTSGCRVGVQAPPPPSSSASSGASSTRRRTHNKVHPLWTAWIIIYITHSQTVINILKYLLEMCATSVRTSLTRLKTKKQRRRSSSWSWS